MSLSSAATLALFTISLDEYAEGKVVTNAARTEVKFC
jgi:hypothetical protein